MGKLADSGRNHTQITTSSSVYEKELLGLEESCSL